MSPTFADSYCVFFRQPCCANAFLHFGNVIWHPFWGPCAGFRIVNGIGGTRVTVAGLTYAPRVDDQFRVKLNRHIRLGLFNNDSSCAIVLGKTALNMGMSYKAPGRFEIFKVQTRGHAIENVFPQRVPRTAMRHRRFAAHFYFRGS